MEPARARTSLSCDGLLPRRFSPLEASSFSRSAFRAWAGKSAAASARATAPLVLAPNRKGEKRRDPLLSVDRLSYDLPFPLRKNVATREVTIVFLDEVPRALSANRWTYRGPENLRVTLDHLREDGARLHPPSIGCERTARF